MTVLCTPLAVIRVSGLCGGQEELAAVNLAKYRKVQHDLEEAEGRAEAAENALARTRTSSRSSVSASRVLHFAFFFTSSMNQYGNNNNNNNNNNVRLLWHDSRTSVQYDEERNIKIYT